MGTGERRKFKFDKNCQTEITFPCKSNKLETNTPPPPQQNPAHCYQTHSSILYLVYLASIEMWSFYTV